MHFINVRLQRMSAKVVTTLTVNRQFHLQLFEELQLIELLS